MTTKIQVVYNTRDNNRYMSVAPSMDGYAQGMFASGIPAQDFAEAVRSLVGNGILPTQSVGISVARFIQVGGNLGNLARVLEQPPIPRMDEVAPEDRIPVPASDVATVCVGYRPGLAYSYTGVQVIDQDSDLVLTSTYTGFPANDFISILYKLRDSGAAYVRLGLDAKEFIKGGYGSLSTFDAAMIRLGGVFAVSSLLYCLTTDPAAKQSMLEIAIARGINGYLGTYMGGNFLSATTVSADFEEAVATYGPDLTIEAINYTVVEYIAQGNSLGDLAYLPSAVYDSIMGKVNDIRPGFEASEASDMTNSTGSNTEEAEDLLSTYLSNISTLGYAEDVDDNTDYNIETDRKIAATIGIAFSGYAWAIGDHLLAMRKRYGSLGDELLDEFCTLYGVGKVATLRNYVTTAEAWPVDERVVARGVTWSHHATLNPVGTEMRQSLILRVGPEKLSCRRLADIARLYDSNLVDLRGYGTGEEGVIDSYQDYGPTGSTGPSQRPVADSEYEQQADRFAGNSSNYDGGDAMGAEPKIGTFKASKDVLALADQLEHHFDIGEIATLVRELSFRFNL